MPVYMYIQTEHIVKTDTHKIFWLFVYIFHYLPLPLDSSNTLSSLSDAQTMICLNMNHKLSSAVGILKNQMHFLQGYFDWHILLMGLFTFFLSETYPTISNGDSFTHYEHWFSLCSVAEMMQWIICEICKSLRNPVGWKVVHQCEINVILWSPQFIQ